MKIIIVLFSFILLSCTTIQAAEGLIIKTNDKSVRETTDTLETIVKKKGFTVFARINHAAAAIKIGNTNKCFCETPSLSLHTGIKVHNG